MLFELPECRRCLFCMPLRLGIIIFGYLNLIFSMLMLGLFSWLHWVRPPAWTGASLYRGARMYAQMWLPVLLYVLEVIFNIMLIVGGHKKNKTIMRAYYFYGIITTAAASVAAAISMCLGNPHSTLQLFFIDVVLGISAFVIHVYLLLLIHSELTKPRYHCGTAFVNHVVQFNSPDPARG